EERNCLTLFISADMADRIKRIAVRHKLSESKAKDLIERTDKGRSSYYNYFSGKTWGAAASYHLCINTSLSGIDETVRLISHVAGIRFGLTEKRE
ncbi:MAG: cytidylate kinase-like family protein, partial [Bacteroidales bacterium]|nr:cytidylate kinase-like family protein [Bacteroidales bacterium]